MGLPHLTVSVLIACALGGVAVVPDEPVPTTTVDDVDVAVPGIGSRAALDDFLASDAAKTVVLDVASGRVVAVGLDDRIARGRTDVTPPVPGPGSLLAGTAAAGSPAAPPSR